MTTTYAGFNDVHLTEKLQEVLGLSVPRCGACAGLSGSWPSGDILIRDIENLIEFSDSAS